MRAGVLDVLDALELLQRRRPRRVEAQQLREAEHRVERRAQLVAHARQELGLGAARGFERLARLPLGARQLQRGDVAQHHRHQRAALGFGRENEASSGNSCAVGAPADELVQRAGRLSATWRGDCGSIGLRGRRDEAFDRAADRVARRRRRTGVSAARLKSTTRPSSSIVMTPSVTASTSRSIAYLALAQRGLHLQALA